MPWVNRAPQPGGLKGRESPALNVSRAGRDAGAPREALRERAARSTSPTGLDAFHPFVTILSSQVPIIYRGIDQVCLPGHPGGGLCGRFERRSCRQEESGNRLRARRFSRRHDETRPRARPAGSCSAFRPRPPLA